VSRHHAHAGNHFVMAVGTVVVLACAAGIAAVMVRILGGLS
jgi:hypothetical protein